MHSRKRVHIASRLPGLTVSSLISAVYGSNFSSTQLSNTTPADAVKKVKEELAVKQPVIVKLPGDDHVDFFVLLDRELIKVDGGATDALQLLIEIFYVFDVDYPGDVLYVYKFLDHVFGLGYFKEVFGPVKAAIKHIADHKIPSGQPAQ